ncbi:MAG: response regulator transcription factor [Nitrospira sp.]|nr:response regulator transcription factor [Nitrospira sp.]
MDTTLIDRVKTIGADGADRLKTKCIRVLLVDDHFLVRQGLRKYLSRHLDIELVGEATDGEEAVKLTDLLEPDVVVMDIHMPRMNGIEATGSIIRKYPHLPVIGLSFYVDNGTREAFLDAGACLLLEKETAYQHLPQAMYQAVDRSVDAGSPARCRPPQNGRRQRCA